MHRAAMVLNASPSLESISTGDSEMYSVTDTVKLAPPSAMFDHGSTTIGRHVVPFYCCTIEAVVVNGTRRSEATCSLWWGRPLLPRWCLYHSRKFEYLILNESFMVSMTRVSVLYKERPGSVRFKLFSNKTIQDLTRNILQKNPDMILKNLERILLD